MNTSLKKLLLGESSDTTSLITLLDQGELFPRVAVGGQPIPATGKDNIGWFVADDKFRYLAKSTVKGRHLPLNEFICTSIARSVGVVSAPSRVLVLPNGDEVFGSRDIADKPEVTGKAHLLTWYIRNVEDKSFFWRMLVVDLVLSNCDRDIDNLVGFNHLGQVNLAAIDYSRALLHHGAQLPVDPFIANGFATGKFARWRHKSGHPLDKIAVEQTIELVKSLPAREILRWIESCPSSWQVPDLTKPLLDWWDSAGRIRRLERIEQGISHGEFVV